MNERQLEYLNRLKREYTECSRQSRLLGKKVRGGPPVSAINRALSIIYKYKARMLWSEICELTGLAGMDNRYD